MTIGISTIAGGLVVAWTIHFIARIVYNAALHPLASFPGPWTASTGWYKVTQELFLGRNWIDVLRELHGRYGKIVRVGPNELHFSSPDAYLDIYNNSNRWDKEYTLYHCFGEDRSSFGFLTYREAKQRKDVLAPLFSKRAILDLQTLVKRNVERMCEGLAANEAKGKSSDILLALRTFTLDTIINYCFGQDIHAAEAPDFQAPIAIAMDAASPAFTLFRHFEPIRLLVFSLPGWLTKLTNPLLAGLVDLQTLLGAQVSEVVRNPLTLDKSPHPIIYHRLLDPDLNKPTGVPSPESLYEEAQALLFGGADSSANTTMFGAFEVLQQPPVLSRLKAELREAWPDLSDPMPPLENLEKLPYLTAVIKESLRVSPGVPAPLPRVVPVSGAKIGGEEIPAGTIVGSSAVFVHSSPEIWGQEGREPERFDPERWIATTTTKTEPREGDGAGPPAGLEKWLVAFSRGPRSCLGQNLGMCELYFAFAALFRRFELELDGTEREHLRWKECFLPWFDERHMRAFCRVVKE